MGLNPLFTENCLSRSFNEKDPTTMLPGTLTDINIKNGTNEIQITDLFSDTSLHFAWVRDGNGVIYPICVEI